MRLLLLVVSLLCLHASTSTATSCVTVNTSTTCCGLVGGSFTASCPTGQVLQSVAGSVGALTTLTCGGGTATATCTATSCVGLQSCLLTAANLGNCVGTIPSPAVWLWRYTCGTSVAPQPSSTYNQWLFLDEGQIASVTDSGPALKASSSGFTLGFWLGLDDTPFARPAGLVGRADGYWAVAIDSDMSLLVYLGGVQWDTGYVLRQPAAAHGQLVPHIYHIAVTYDHTTPTARLYINSYLMATKSLAAAISLSPPAAVVTLANKFGSLVPNGANAYFDELTVYSRLLTAVEVGTLMNTPSSPPATNLVGQWRLDGSLAGTPAALAYYYAGTGGATFEFSPLRVVFNAQPITAGLSTAVSLTVSDPDTPSASIVRLINSLPAKFYDQSNVLRDGSTTLAAVPATLSGSSVTYLYASAVYDVPDCPFDSVAYSLTGPGGQYSDETAFYVATNKQYNYATPTAASFVEYVPEDSNGRTITLRPQDLDYTNALRFGDADSAVNGYLDVFGSWSAASAGNWALSAWFSPGVTLPASNVTIVAQCSGASTVWALQLCTDGTLALRGPATGVSANYSFAYDKWYFLSVGRNGPNTNVLVNNAQPLGAPAGFVAIAAGSWQLRFGADCASPAPAYGLKVHDVQFDLAVLPTAVAVRTSYASAPSGPLQVRMNEGSGAPSVQASGATTPALTGVTLVQTGSSAWRVRNEPSCRVPALSVSIVSAPTFGQLYQTADGITKGAALSTGAVTDSLYRVIYDVTDSNAVGLRDSFTYTATDQAGLTSTAGNVTINVTSTADFPIANDVSVQGTEDVCLLVNLSIASLDSTPPIYAVVPLPPGKGGLYTDASCSTLQTAYPVSASASPYTVYYKGDPGEGGANYVSFYYYAEDAQGRRSDYALVRVNLTQVITRPRANSFAISVEQNNTVAFVLTGADPENNAALTFFWSALPLASFGVISDSGTTLPVTIGTGYAQSTVFFFTAGALPGFSTASFYAQTAATGNSTVARLNITITLFNNPPTSNNVSVSTNENTMSSPFNLSGSDVESAVTFRIGIPPAYGALSSGLTTGNYTNGVNVRYTPVAWFFGSDFFTYQAFDGQKFSAWSYVTVNVVQTFTGCIVANASVTTNEDTSASVSLSISFYGNTQWNDYDQTYVVSSSQTGLSPDLTFPSLYLLGPSAPLQFTYTPPLDFYGSASFTVIFQQSSGPATCTATVDVVVLSVIDAPTCSSVGPLSGDINTMISFTALTSSVETSDALTVLFPTPPTFGTLYYGSTLTLAVYDFPFLAPNATTPFGFLSNTTGNFSIDYTAVDVTAQPNVAQSGPDCTASFVVTNTSTPPVAYSQYFLQVNQDGSLPIALQFSPGSNAVVSATFDLTNLVGTLSAVASCASSIVSPFLSPSATVYYCPPALAHSPPYPFTNFSFLVTDSGSLTSNSAVVTINVLNVADNPTAFDLTVSSVERVVTPVDLNGTCPDCNPYDMHGYLLSLPPATQGAFYFDALATQPIAAGVATPLRIYFLSANSWPRCPGSNNAGCTANFVISYQLEDPGSLLRSAAALITLTSSAVDDPPVAFSKTYTVQQSDANAAITLSGYDPDDTTLVPIVTSLPLGTLLDASSAPVTVGTPLASLTLLYTPLTGDFGSPYTSFTFRLQDPEGVNSTADATATINVLERDFPPVAPDFTVDMVQNTELRLQLQGSDDHTAFENLRAVVSVLSPDSNLYQLNGTLIQAGDAVQYSLTVVFVPGPLYVGVTTFSYYLLDALSQPSSPATIVSVNVSAYPQVPVALDSAVSLSEDAGPVTITATGFVPGGGTATYYLLNWPTDVGTFALTNGSDITGAAAPVALLGGSGDFSYTPLADYFGSFQVKFNLINAVGNVSNDGYVNVTVDNVLDGYTAVSQSLTNIMNQILPVKLLAYSVDIPGTVTDLSSVQFVVTSLPVTGAQLWSSTDGVTPMTVISAPYVVSPYDTVIYVPLEGNTSADSFDFTVQRVTPSLYGVDSGTISIDNQAFIYPPVAYGDSTTLFESITLTANITLTGDLAPAPYLYGCISTGLFDIASLNPSSLGTLTQTDGTPITVGANQCVQLTSANANQLVYIGPVALYPQDGRAFAAFKWRWCNALINGTDPYTPFPQCSQEALYRIYIVGQNDPPVAYDQYLTLYEDQHYFWVPNASDSDSAFFITVYDAPLNGTGGVYQNTVSDIVGNQIFTTANGTVVISRLVYVPPLNANNFSGRWTYTATDTLNSSFVTPLTTVYYTVLPVNDPPVAQNFSASVTASRPATIALNNHASDVENDPLEFWLVALPDTGDVYDMTDSNGQLVACDCTPCSNCSFTPYRVQSPNATIQFRAVATNITVSPYGIIEWQAFDGQNWSYLGIISVELVRNLAPTATSSSYTTYEDTNVTVACNGTDSDGTQLTARVIQYPQRGRLYQYDGTLISSNISTAGTLVTDSQFRLVFMPFKYDHSSTVTVGNTTQLSPYTTFSYVVIDSDGASSSNALVSIVVIPVENNPTAYNETITMREEDSKTIVLQGFDPENDPLTYVLTSIPAQGQLFTTLTGLTPIDANDPITEADLPYIIEQSVPQLIYDSPVVDYTTDELYFSLSYLIRVYGAANNTNNTVLQQSNEAWISIVVIPTNDPPLADDITVFMLQNGNATILLSGYDPDTYDKPTVIISALPQFGSLYQYPSGGVGDNFTVADLDRIVTPFSEVTDPVGASGVPNTWRVIYIPPLHENGSPYVTLEYILTDGKADSSPGRVTVYVDAVNEAPVWNPVPALRAFLGSDLVFEVPGNDLESNGPVPLQAYIVSVGNMYNETGSQLFQYYDKGLSKQQQKSGSGQQQLNFTAEVTRGEQIVDDCTLVTDPQRRVIINPQLNVTDKRRTVQLRVQLFDGQYWSAVGELSVLVQRPKTELPQAYRSTTGSIVAPIIGAAAAVVAVLIVIGIIWYRNTRVGDDEDYINMFSNTGEEEKGLLAGGGDDDDDDGDGDDGFKGTDLEQLILDEKYQVVNAMLNAIDVTEYDALAKALIDISEFHGRTLHMLKFFITVEVESAASAGTLFRANSIASKMISAYTRIIGVDYLITTLKTPIETILKKDNAMEVDPKKLKAGESRKANMRLLQLACQNFVDWIVSSETNAPLPFKVLSNHLFHTVEKKFPLSKHSAIGGFLFLRFFCPAIISPEGFKVLQQPPPPPARRALVLIAKALQNLANGVEFGKKEAYMIEVNEFIRKNMEPIKNYFELMVSLPQQTLKISSAEVPLERETAALNLVHKYLYDFRQKIIDVLEGRDGTQSERTDSYSNTSRSGRSRGTHHTGGSSRGTSRSRRGDSSKAGSSKAGSSKGSRLSRHSGGSRSSRSGSMMQPGFGEESATEVSNSSDDDDGGNFAAALDKQIFVGPDGIEYVPTEGELSEGDEILFDDDDLSDNAFSVEEVGTETARALGIEVNEWTNVDDLSLDAEWEKNMLVTQDKDRPGFGQNGEITDPVAALNYVLDSIPPPE